MKEPFVTLYNRRAMTSSATTKEARNDGLRFLPSNWEWAAKETVLVVAAISAICTILDAAIFRGSLPSAYVAHYTSPLWPRILTISIEAAREEVLYRLILTTVLVWMLGKTPLKATPTAYCIAIVFAQFVAVWPVVLAYPGWGALRFWAVGCAWGFLYWRQGWVAALLGHSACHLLLDPLLLLAL